MNAKNEKIYVVVTNSGTIMSKFINLATRAEYTHVSVSLHKDLAQMYSFGRRFAFFPFWSGLVCETLNSGIYKRFPETKCVVLSVKVSEGDYENAKKHIAEMIAIQKKYRYNYMGVVLSMFKVYKKFGKRYYCSEFVREILDLCNANGVNKLSKTAHPQNFLQVSEFECVYKGKLCDYTYKKGQVSDDIQKERFEKI